MDFVSLGMELLLAVLLLAALAYGVRLERRLKALRDSQAGFVEAVRALDAAAGRAEAGLDALRRATDEAQDGLHDRILKAREVKAELERLLARAERAGPQAGPSAAADPRRSGPPEERQGLAAAPRNPIAPSRPLAARGRARDLDDELFEAAPRARRASGDER
jgi:hypothetical protein